MWFVANTTTPPKFYKADKSLISVSAIEWITERYDEFGNLLWQGTETIKDNHQAIHALYESGVKGYKTKEDAKAFAKTLGPKTWNYFNLK
ncbi:hypothetical protein [Pseudoalteromonas sp. T1lg24]|uniref:hypothetical protein n=1 Tax=Pseudoalteromonas sp. T1lg24 TaxID=2077099 RepID=UPI000CF6ECE0|nr:hypothetical protein [Pseudoalteromonas sp. T1lg24]